MADLRYIRVERDAEIAVVFVDRQDKLNTLNAEVVAELGRAFEELGCAWFEEPMLCEDVEGHALSLIHI